MNPLTKLASATRDLLWRSTRHWLSAIGALLTTVSAISFLTILAFELSGQSVGNYAGILSYLILPAVFVAGLVMLPIGLFLLRRRERTKGPSGFPVFNFNDPRLRAIGLVVVALTVVNLMVVSTATFKGLEVMHHDEFCGGTCHNVMEPEAVAHRVTSHAKVYCVDCHIGEGADHFVKAKLRGATQMLQFFAGDVARPVPQTVEVPDTICTRCHAPTRFIDDRLKIRKMFSLDEKAAQKTTVYRMLVGGLRDGQWQGAHKHLGMKIRFQTDEKKSAVGEIEVTRADGGTDTFKMKEGTPPKEAQWRTMGCTDCHSRPAHRFSTPEAIVEKALGRGAIDPELPFIVRESLAALKATYPSRGAAATAIPAALAAFYAKQVPDQDAEGKAKVAAAGALLAEEWSYNNFPDMKVGWGTYVDYLQHEPGCYRCHDKNHENSKGEVVQKRCSGSCHDIIATEEEQPEVMDVLYP